MWRGRNPKNSELNTERERNVKGLTLPNLMV
jgi:hypothetical protein